MQKKKSPANPWVYWTFWRRVRDSNHRSLSGHSVSSEAPRTEIDGSWRKIKDLNLPRNSRGCGLFGTCNPPQLRRYRVSAFFLNILAGPIEFQRKELEFRIEIPLFRPKNHPFGSAWKKPCYAVTHKKSYSQKFSLGQNLMGFESYFQKHIISRD